MKTLVIAGLAFGAATAAHAVPVKQTVYEGTIGKSPIVLQTLNGGPYGAGQYFYRKYRAPISLRYENGQWLELKDCTYDLAGCQVSARLKLTPTADGLTGTWTSIGTGNGKTLPVSLKQVAVRTAKVDGEPTQADALFGLDDGGDLTSDPFVFRQVNGETVYGPETRSGAVGYQTATDKDTGIHYIHLTAAADPAVLTKVNRLLDLQRYQMISYGLECRATPKSETESGGTLGDWDSYDSTVTYATDTLLVIQEGGSTYCGGAHPNNSFTYTMYDMKRGELFDVNRVLKINQPGADGETADTPEYAALLKKLTATSPWFAADVDPECLGPDGVQDDMQAYNLTFNAKGLVLSLTDLPHALGACMGDYYVVPYADLKGMWRPDAKTYFPLAR